MKKKLLKILKWTTIVIASYWFLTTLIFGHTEIDARTGMQSFAWSGLDAIFNEQEFGFFINEQYPTKLRGIDGPYIFDSIQYDVNRINTVIKNTVNKNDAILVRVNNQDKDSFQIALKDSFQNEYDEYEMPSKLVAISDIEGNFNAFYSFLVSNGVIDHKYNWIFGDGHLVLNGDFFDRGSNVTQVLWLIYSLEEKASKNGGKVHLINGNHEVMNLNGRISYVDHKYIELAKQISGKKYWEEAYKVLFSNSSELGNWLRTKKVVKKIGSYIFVHGGLNKQHVENELSISEINNIAERYYGKRVWFKDLNRKEQLVLGSKESPYWDRSLAANFLYKMAFIFKGSSLDESSEADLDNILSFYKAEKIVIGHTIISDVSTDYNGKVIRIDVKHGNEKNSSDTQGLLIENTKEFRIDAKGKRISL